MVYGQYINSSKAINLEGNSSKGTDIFFKNQFFRMTISSKVKDWNFENLVEYLKFDENVTKKIICIVFITIVCSFIIYYHRWSSHIDAKEDVHKPVGKNY